jgi:hypothetical protein
VNAHLAQGKVYISHAEHHSGKLYPLATRKTFESTLPVRWTALRPAAGVRQILNSQTQQKSATTAALRHRCMMAYQYYGIEAISADDFLARTFQLFLL